MNQDDLQFSEDLMVIFYESQKQPVWSELAEQVGLTEQECKRQWQALTHISERLAHITVYEPQQMTLNRLAAHARATHKTEVSFWQKLIPYRLVMGAVFMFGVLFMGAQSYFFVVPTRVAETSPKSHILNEAVKDRLLKTTLDEYTQHTQAFTVTPQKNKTTRSEPHYSLATPVSAGGQAHYSLDSDSDDDLYKTNLNGKEIEGLFFRARKFEQQGYFREALKDYQFLAQFYPTFMAPQTLHVAMARCLENLGQKSEAIELLQRSASRYGSTEDLQVMIEQLKSQTF